jgi:hypothetical protein
MTHDEQVLLMQFAYRFGENLGIENAVIYSFAQRGDLLSSIRFVDGECYETLNIFFNAKILKGEKIVLLSHE